jgi:ABC-2 type transport system permease protein
MTGEPNASLPNDQRRISTGFSFARARAIFAKEFVQMRRDRLTFAMMVGIPIMQLLLFGFAINTDPRHLPALIEARDTGPAVRAIVQGLETSEYFDVVGEVRTPEEVDSALASGRALFVVTVPENFERDLARGDRPQLLLDTDATDPVASGSASAAFPRIVQSAIRPLIDDPERTDPAVEAIVHARYNPAGRTAVNIVPGLLGVILTMTMTLLTAMALTRERETGTLETLLAAPTHASEVMAGKIGPFIVVGLLQVLLMLTLAFALFDVPFLGDPLAFSLATAEFVVVNLSLGFLFSTLAKSQLQAMQMTFFILLPSILLSGFMFPFRGMPGWAQAIGNVLPNTHFIRAVRAVMLKGADVAEIWTELAALGAILVVIFSIAMLRYRRTLD